MKKRNYEVDLMKAVAIVLVVLCHVAQPIKGLPLFFENVTKLGQLGVQCFFCNVGLSVLRNIRQYAR